MIFRLGLTKRVNSRKRRALQFRTVARKSSNGGLCVCAGGLDIEIAIITPFISSVSYFNLGGHGALFGRAEPNEAPRSNGTECVTSERWK